jgi:hypothetical protein
MKAIILKEYGSINNFESADIKGHIRIRIKAVFDGQLISVVDVPGKEDFEILFQKNASFHPIGANAYSLSTNPGHWKTYKYILNYISGLFDSNVLIKPPITVLGSLSVGTVKKAHELLENNSVQGKLIMTCD